MRRRRGRRGCGGDGGGRWSVSSIRSRSEAEHGEQPAATWAQAKFSWSTRTPATSRNSPGGGPEQRSFTHLSHSGPSLTATANPQKGRSDFHVKTASLPFLKRQPFLKRPFLSAENSDGGQPESSAGHSEEDPDSLQAAQGRGRKRRRTHCSRSSSSSRRCSSRSGSWTGCTWHTKFGRPQHAAIGGAIGARTGSRRAGRVAGPGAAAAGPGAEAAAACDSKAALLSWSKRFFVGPGG